MTDDAKYMKIALDEAKEAMALDEIPVGAVLVKNNLIIAKGRNTRELENNTLGHAEINVIKEANRILNTWDLSGCTLYVSLEPCLMCSGAIKESRISKIVYGATDSKGGFLKSNLDINEFHKIEVLSGVLENESKLILKDFFKVKRENMIKISKRSFEDLQDYFSLRKEVFVEEQGVSLEEEFDDYDKKDMFHVEHVVASINKNVIGTMRLIYTEDYIKVGRLAVHKAHRDKKIGTRFLDYATKQAESRGYKELRLGAQLTAVAFYQKNGFELYGEVFDDAGIEHIMMKKRVGIVR